MSVMERVIRRLRGKVATGGIACPLCRGRTAVLKATKPTGHVTRRRVCGTCGLRFTTTERIVGGYSPADLRNAEARISKSSVIQPGGSCVSDLPNTPGD